MADYAPRLDQRESLTRREQRVIKRGLIIEHRGAFSVTDISIDYKIFGAHAAWHPNHMCPKDYGKIAQNDIRA